MNTQCKETPAMLLSGGQPMNADMMSCLMAPTLARNPKPNIAYIGAANGDRLAFFGMIKPLLLQGGARSVTFVKLARDSVDLSEARGTLSASDAVFISGGEVEDGMNWLKKHGLTEFLGNLYAEGKPFLCTSAGTIMMGERWVRWDDPEDDDTAELFDCLGVIPCVFDTHAEDEDWIELKTVLRLMGDGARGYGIPKGGIISADSSGALHALRQKLLTFTYKNGTYSVQ